jgi:hypothetical protein
MSRAKTLYFPRLGETLSHGLHTAKTKWVTKSGSAIFDPDQVWGAQVRTGIKNVVGICDGIDVVKLGDWFDNKDHLTDYEIKIGNTVRSRSEIVDTILLVKSNRNLTAGAHKGNAFFDVMFEVDVCENDADESLVLRCKRYLQFQYTRSSNTIRWINNVRNNSLTMWPIATHLVAPAYRCRTVSGMRKCCLLDGYIAYPIHSKPGFEPAAYDLHVPLDNMIL